MVNKINDVSIWGYGGEEVNIPITEAQYDYWKDREDELTDYCLCWDDEDVSVSIPMEMRFLQSEDGEYHNAIWDADNIIIHETVCTLDSAKLDVQVDGEMVFENEEIGTTELNETYIPSNEEDDYAGHKYIMTYETADKGTFFALEEEVEVEDFSVDKMEIMTTENYHGEELIIGVRYDNVDLDVYFEDSRNVAINCSVWINQSEVD